MPDTTVQIIGKERRPVRGVQGLRLTPDVSIAEAAVFDVLLVPGGYGQQALMHDEEVLLTPSPAFGSKLPSLLPPGSYSRWVR
jgi:putative intracellular protease/amidase